MTLQINDQKLLHQNQVLLSALPAETEIVADALENGVFLRFSSEKAAAKHVWSLGDLAAERLMAHHRYEPYWMLPAACKNAGEVPPETQFLLAELDEKLCAVLVPLIENSFRAALQGSERDGENGLQIVAESGDPAVVAPSMTALFVAVGDDPHALAKNAARSVAAFCDTRLREEKPVPEFIDQFGWCTWDAFYQEVSHDKVREGLESFKAGGVQPKYLILDDGWQSVAEKPTGEKRLTGFAANEKFPGDLQNTVAMAKSEFDIETFLVWHAMNGYWGGVDDAALPGYGTRVKARDFNAGILHHRPDVNGWFGGLVGTVAPEMIYKFFQDYHRHLRAQGVDGVKVDSQATLEGIGQGLGGRVELMRRYREALEGSVQVHFAGNLINCMSNANEMHFMAQASNITRTSTDFWPNRPESHGLHVWTNAQISLFWGEFTQPDWDMFQSGHPMGAYHAAARAVGGCPVYVSDKPGAHNFDLLKKLVLPDGGVLRFVDAGLPTRDSLFCDPTKEDVLLKIANINEVGGVIGVFNARYHEDAAQSKPIGGFVSPADLGEIEGERFAVQAHGSGEVRILTRKQKWAVSLPQLEFEIFGVARVEEQGKLAVAALGMTGLFNSSNAVGGAFFMDDETFSFFALVAGTYTLWCNRKPAEVALDSEEPVKHSYDKAKQLLTVEMTCDHAHSVFVRF